MSQQPLTNEEINLHKHLHHRLKSAEREKQILEQLMETSTALLSGRDLRGVLDIILQGVQAIGFDRIRLYLLAEDRQALIGQAQVGMEVEFVGFEFPIADNIHAQALLADPCPHIFKRRGRELWPYEQRLAKEGVKQWLGVPLLLHGKFIGMMSADNKFSQRPIEETELELVAVFAAQAAAAIENARLRDKEREATQKAERRARNLKAVQKVSTAISSLMELDKILEATCRAAVELFRVEHSGLVLFEEPAYERGWVVAEYPKLGTSGLEIPVRNVPAEEMLIRSKEPLVLFDVSLQSTFGPVHDIFKRFDIHSILIVPVISKGRVLGSFSLDSIDHPRTFTEEETELCQIFAAQVAVAVENAQLYKEVAQGRDHSEWMAKQLIALHAITWEIQAELNLPQLLNLISRLAAELLGADAGGILLLDEEKQSLKFKGAYGLSLKMVEGTCDRVGSSIAGRVVEMGQPIIANDILNNSHFYNPAADGEGLLAIMSTPLQIGGKIIGTLDVHSKSNLQAFDQDNLHILSLMATQAAIAIQNASLFEQRNRRTLALEGLYRTSLDLTGRLYLPELVKSILDRAVQLLQAKGGCLYLLDESGERIKVMAVSNRPDLKLGMTRKIQGDVVGQVVKTKTALSMPDYQNWPNRWRQNDLYGFTVVAGAPIVWRDKIWGVIALHDEVEGRDFDSEELRLLTHLGNLAAVALENSKLFQETETARARLQSFYQASNAVVSSQNPEQVLQDIVDRACLAAKASGVVLRIIDQKDQTRYTITGGRKERFNKSHPPRPDGVSMHVMRTGQTSIAEDTRRALPPQARPGVFWDNVRAAACLPVSLEGQGIGVMWFRYDQPRRFSEFELEAFQLYVNQTAIAYDNARRIKELDHMRQAAEVLAGTAGLPEVLKQIVQSAQNILQADSAFIWAYDVINDQFIRKDSVSIGISIESWIEFQKVGPQQGGTTHTVMRRGWIGVENISNRRQYPFIGRSTRRLLENIGAQSFQGITLTVGKEKLGVLYVNYNRPRTFSEEEQKTARTFANHAALALKNNTLLDQIRKALDQVSKANRVANEVAKFIALETDLRKTLDSIVQGTRNILGCDVVTLWPYDPNRKEFVFPPAMSGVKYEEEVLQLGRVWEGAVVRNILPLDDLYVAEERLTDPLLGGVFAEREGLISSVGIPLSVREYKVGGMIASYRSSHHFTDDQLEYLRLFAHQAAVAIDNAQLFEQIRRHANLLDAAAKIARGATDIHIDRLLNETVRLISKVFRVYHTGIFLLDENYEYAVLQATYPQTGEGMLKIGYRLKVGLDGIIGFVTKTGAYHLAPDVKEDFYYLANPNLPLTRSEIVFPLIARGQVIGALDAQSIEVINLQPEEIATLQTMTDQLANAIHNAQLYQQATERLKESNILQQVAVSLAGASELQEVLNLVMTEAMKLTNTHDGRILLWDVQAGEFSQALRIGPEGSLQPYHSTTTRTKDGLYRLVIDQRQPIAIPDALQDARVNPAFIATGYRAMLLVPLSGQGEIMGVLSVISREPRLFSQRQVDLLKTLANQVALAIDRARRYEETRHQYEELEQTKDRLAANTAIAWAGMVSATWHHHINNNATTIRDQVKLLYLDLQAGVDAAQLKKRLSVIERAIDKIKQSRQIPADLTIEQGIETININDLLVQWKQKGWRWDEEPYNSIEEPKLNLTEEAPLLVRANVRWLRLAFDRLIENAVKAMSESNVKSLQIRTRLVDTRVEIDVTDTGPGIPLDIQLKLFKQGIKESEGMGIGLLLAQMIVQVYGGDISIGSTAPTGTTMTVWLPLKRDS